MIMQGMVHKVHKITFLFKKYEKVVDIYAKSDMITRKA